MATPLGAFTKKSELSKTEQELVCLAWGGANSSADNNLCFHSNFPVGAAILAFNRNSGQTKMFRGCNVENAFFPPTICAERNAATTAAVEGYTQFQAVAVVCRKVPGGSPCGLCRQVLNQFGRDAVLLNIVDYESNVRRATVGDLLPAASDQPVAFATLCQSDQNLVKRVISLMKRSHVPYSKRPRAALFSLFNNKGKIRFFEGVSDDNASYGGSALAETVAMRTARTATCGRKIAGVKSPWLIVTVEDPTAPNPIDGECLQVLREFGAEASIFLVNPKDMSVVPAYLSELLPDSFGPESL